MDAVGVEAVGRLVEDQELGLAQHRLGQRQALTHAHGVPLDLVIAALLHPDQVEELADLLLVDGTEESCEKAQVVATGEEAVERGLLERGSEQAGRPGVIRPAVVPADPGGAAIRMLQPEEDSDGGRLARPVGAQEPKHLALGDIQGDLVEGADAAEPLGEPIDLDDGGYWGHLELWRATRGSATSYRRGLPSRRTDGGPPSADQTSTNPFLTAYRTACERS